MDETMSALYAGFAVESPSGVCSSVQKLRFLSVRRILASSEKCVRLLQQDRKWRKS